MRSGGAPWFPVNETGTRYQCGRLGHVVVRPTPTPRIVSDPDDDVVIGTALAAKADLLVTGDRPLLSVSEYQGVRIVSVSGALELIAGR